MSAVRVRPLASLLTAAVHTQQGQLLVWDWRSEAYVLRQQGHHHDVAAIAFSHDGALLATGADDAKVSGYTCKQPAVMPSHALFSGTSFRCLKPADRHRHRKAGPRLHCLAVAGVGLLSHGRCMTGCRQRVDHMLVAKACLCLAPSSKCMQVKLWVPGTGTCFVTFSAHTAPVTALAFLRHSAAVVSASLDGTVRAWDLLRYRNFRTMTSPTPVQFNSLAVDPAGEVRCWWASSSHCLRSGLWSLL